MDRHATRRSHESRADVERRVDKMVRAGRLSDEDAARVRSAGPSELEDVLTGIQLEHIKARLDEAVAASRLSKEEAEGILGAIKEGQDPRSLPALRAVLRRRGS